MYAYAYQWLLCFGSPAQKAAVIFFLSVFKKVCARSNGIVGPSVRRALLERNPTMGPNPPRPNSEEEVRLHEKHI